MKTRHYLTLLFTLTALASQGQVTLSGAISGTFATLQAAFNAINNGGGSGTVTATITADHILTATAQLNQTNYTVNVVPAGIRTVSGNLNSPLVRLNGADNVIIDGQNTASNKLTFSNSNTGLSASAIQLQSDASNNMIKNCILEGSSTGQFDNGVLNIKGISGSTGNDNNTIMGNEIKAAGSNLPRNGICMEGLNASVLNNNNIISNNNIHDWWASSGFSDGFFSYRYNQATQITGNSFYQTATRTGSGGFVNHRAIEIDDGGFSTTGGFVISNNFIGGSAPQCGGTAYTITHPTNVAYFGCIWLDGGTTSATSVQGNTIKNISATSNLGGGGNWDILTGIDLLGSGSYNVGTTSGNTIGALTGTGSISITQNFTSGATTHTNGIRNLAAGTVVIKNNTLGSITTTMTGTLGYVSFYGIYSRQTDNTTIELNTVGGTTANSIQFAPNASHDASLHGIMIEDISGSVLNNTVQNLTSNARVELNGIFLWNNISGKTQTCTGNTVKNLSTTSGNGLDVTGILAVSNSTGNITYNLNINNNTIMDCSVGATTTGECDLIGVWVVPRGTSSYDFVNGSVSNNTITNLSNMNTFSTAGLDGIVEIQLYNGSGMSINGNTISNFTSTTPLETYGILTFVNNPSLLPSATTLNIDGNTIHSINATATTVINPTGILGNGKNVNIRRNKVYNITAPNAQPGSNINGILLRGGTNAGVYEVSNNMISLGNTVSNDVEVNGILHDQGVFAGLTVLYNSVFIGGTNPGGGIQHSFAFDRRVTTLVSSLRNNVFYNARTGGLGSHVAIGNTAATPVTGWSAAASNYNFLVSSDANKIGRWGVTNYNFPGWQTISGGDGNSEARVTPGETIPANFFVNTAVGDLSVNTANPAEASHAQNSGIPVSVTVDYFNTPRSVSMPDIGAHEFLTLCTADAGADATICAGQSHQLNATPFGAASYSWSPALGLNNPNIQNPLATPASTTTYAVVVTQPNGCTESDQVTINVNPAPPAMITPGGPTAFCQGGTVTLTASGGGTYAWSTNETTVAITVSASGTYVVTVTAANGCTATASQVVTVNPNPTAVITPGGPTTFCQGGSVTLTASGGTSYEWSTMETTAAISVSASGTYTVTVTDANGCTDTDSQAVTVNSLPTAAITPSGPTTFCQGGLVMLTASGGLSYEWSTMETTAAISVSTSDTYTVTVTDANGCTDTESQGVTVNSLPTAAITPSGPTTFCQGGSVMLTASGGVSYQWSTMETAAAISVSTSGTYSVTVTDANGCTDTESQGVKELAIQNIWNGMGDGVQWSDPANWSDGVVPFFCQHVVIPAGNTVTVMAGVNAVGKTLEVNIGAVLLVSPIATLDIMN